MSEKTEVLTPKEAIQAMINGEILYYKNLPTSKECKCWWDTISDRFYFQYPDEPPAKMSEFTNLYRHPAPKKRPMTRWECIAWANSDASRGWVVRWQFSFGPQKSDNRYSDWQIPQWGYDHKTGHYQRARLLPDLSGIDESSICGFEIEEGV